MNPSEELGETYKDPIAHALEADKKLMKLHNQDQDKDKKKTKKEEFNSLTDAYSSMYQEGLSIADQMKVSSEYFKKRNARSPEEKAAEEKKDAESRAERGAMHKKPDPYKARAGESD